VDNNAPLTEAVYYILIALRNPNHGYGIIQDINSLTSGRVVLGAGTLYGAIQSLLDRGWIELVSVQATSRKKKEYSITESGIDALIKEWKRLEELLAHGKLIDI
jgi:DNA-binding PadR family transcriptional regulator